MESTFCTFASVKASSAEKVAAMLQSLDTKGMPCRASVFAFRDRGCLFVFFWSGFGWEKLDLQLDEVHSGPKLTDAVAEVPTGVLQQLTSKSDKRRSLTIL